MMYYIQESDVVQLLKALNNKERKNLANNILPYLQTINVKQSPINHQIFAYIIRFTPKFSQKKLSKAHLLSAIPSLASETVRFNKRMSMIKQAILQFVANQNLQKSENEIDALLHILTFLKDKKALNHLFVETQTKIKNRLEKQWQKKHINTFSYHQAYILYASLISHEAFRDEQKHHFQQSLYYSEMYFLCQQLPYYCHFMNIAIDSNKKISTYYDNIHFHHLSEVLPNLSRHKVFKETIIQMYYKVYLLLKNWESDDKSYYEDYITFLFGEYKKNKNLKNFEIFTLTAQHNLFAYAQNYLTWKIRKINKKLKNEEFDLSKTKKHFLLEKRNTYNIDFLNLHELQLQNKALIEISASMMRNIVLKKFEAGLYDGLSIFLEKYISKVAEKNRKAVTKYAYAHLYFAKKEYKKAIETLLEDNDDKTARMPNHFFKTDSYRLLIKSMFEIGVEEELEKYIARFRTYLTNNETKENKALFERHKRFLVYIKELLDASKRNDKMAFVELKAKIERRKDTVNSEWLIENIEMYLK